jgi:serine/threonine protein kinase
MAPEALQSSKITYSADIYAFGITMWQIKENKIPYHDIESNDIVAYAVVKNNLRPDTVNFSANCISKVFLPKENNCFQVQKVRKTSIQSTDLKFQLCNQNPSMCWLEDKENLAPDEKICSSPEILMDVPIFFSKNFVQSKKLWKSAKKVKIQIEREPSCLELFTDLPRKRARKLSDNFDIECMFDDPWKENIMGYLENKYVRLYKNCWQKAPESRPSNDQILKKLNKMLC